MICMGRCERADAGKGRGWIPLFVWFGGRNIVFLKKCKALIAQQALHFLYDLCRNFLSSVFTPEADNVAADSLTEALFPEKNQGINRLRHALKPFSCRRQERPQAQPFRHWYQWRCFSL